MTQVDGCSDQSCLSEDNRQFKVSSRAHIHAHTGPQPQTSSPSAAEGRGPAWGDALNVIGSFGDPSGLSENIILPSQKVNRHLIPRRKQHGPYHSPCGR